MQNGDETSPSISLAGRALLVKMLIALELHGNMLITLELCGTFGSNFLYLCI